MTTSKPKSPNISSIETIVFLVVWMGIFSIPFFQYRQFDSVDWELVNKEWLRMSTFLFIFLLNAYLFVPRFLFYKEYWIYIAATTFATVIIVGISIYLSDFLAPPQPIAMPPMDLGPGMPPMELGSKMPAPMGFRPPAPHEHKSIFLIFVDNFIISILVVAAGTAFKMMSQWLLEEGKRKDVEKEQLKTELALLRHQVSPHFFMNTLNNIHALVDINTETAKDAIIRLSTLMRYLLYDTAQGHTSLRKELEFIESYISLMKLRFSKKVTIEMEFPKVIPEIEIPPMLFISFIENAFKHGVSYQADSFVSFKIEIIDHQLICHIQNSQQPTNNEFDKNYSGIGMVNIQKSLDLLFGKSYTLVIKDEDKIFEVQLTIPLHDDKMPSH